jgi:siroheme decarboxylase
VSHWECNECEYQTDGLTPPTRCPLCGEPAEGFTETHPVELDGLDRRILNVVQSSFPLCERPFLAIGRTMDLAEEDVIARVRRMKAAAIRQISAIFDSRSLGYHSTLVAFEFAPQDLDAGASVVSRHPGVSHNYRRDHRFNLWFTMTVHSSFDLKAEIERLFQASGARMSLLLPTVRLFKIGVNFDATGEREATQKETLPIVKGMREAHELTETEKQAVRALQRDLPLVERPFIELAERHGGGQSQQDLFDYASNFQSRGIMRRYSAVLRHRSAGFAANAMGVWIVPEERLESVGSAIANFASVSHCYQRPTYPPDWPYNLFSMVHGRTIEDCESVLAAISRETGIRDYTRLFSTREYKKVRVKYFTWEPSLA